MLAVFSLILLSKTSTKCDWSLEAVLICNLLFQEITVLSDGSTPVKLKVAMSMVQWRPGVNNRTNQCKIAVGVKNQQISVRKLSIFITAGNFSTNGVVPHHESLSEEVLRTRQTALDMEIQCLETGLLDKNC